MIPPSLPLSCCFLAQRNMIRWWVKGASGCQVDNDNVWPLPGRKRLSSPFLSSPPLSSLTPLSSLFVAWWFVLCYLFPYFLLLSRALLLNPRILLLDEATSALDAESEYLVREAIDRLMVGRTVVIIAHRLSTTKDASKIVVMSEGKISAVGTHNELLAENEIYRQVG